MDCRLETGEAKLSGWRRWVAWPVSRPGWAALVVALLCVMAVIRIAQVKPDATIDAMFPENSPASAAILRVMHTFGAAEEMLVLASLSEEPGGARTPDVGKLLAYAQRLEAAVADDAEAKGLCEGVSYKVDAAMRGFFEKHLVPGGLFYLSEDQLAQAKQRLSPEGIRRQIAQNEVMVAAPGPAASTIAKITLQDPLRLHEFVMDRLRGAKPFETYQGSEAFLSADGGALLIRVKGKHPPSEIEYAKSLTHAIERIAAKANTDGLRIDFAGSYPIATASEKAIRGDLVNSITCSAIFLQGLFLLAYRKPLRLFALAFMPVSLGVLLGFGANTLFQPTITPMTAAIGAVLAGLAIDYSVYLISDYESQRKLGFTPQAAAVQTVIAVSPALSAAWFTTLVGFVAIGWSSVPGIRDFARIGALGLTGAYVTAVLLLPGLMALADRRSAEEAQARPRMRFAALPLLLWISRHRRGCLVGSGLFFGACVLVLATSKEGALPLERDLAVMHPQPNAPLEAQARIARRFGSSPDALLVHLKAHTPEDLVAMSHDARTRLMAAEVKKKGGVSGTFSLADLLPDPRTAKSRLAAVREVDAEKVVSDFKAAIEESSFDPAKYAPYAEFLGVMLRPERAPEIGDLMKYPSLAGSLLPSDAVHTGQRPTEALMMVFVNNTLDRQEERKAAVETIRSALAPLPGATLTGISVVGYDTERVVHQDLPKLIGIAAVIVGLYLLLFFRSVKAAVLATVPMLAGILVLLAAARLVDYRLNMVNLIAAPLLIGVDVDYGIFLVSLAASRTDFTRRTLAERLDSGLYAVFVCLGSALLGFGTLYFTSVPAVQSLGFAVAVGLAASLVFTLFFRLPLLFGGLKDASPSEEGE